MLFAVQGRIHAAIHAASRTAAAQTGQGTVEYVALILLIAAVLAGVIAAGQGLKGGGIAQTVVGQLKDAIEGVKPGSDGGRSSVALRGGPYAHAVPDRPGDPRRRPIAVFDSGVGGLTVLHELLVQLPHEDFLYLGDTARFPYGERSAEELERFALEIAETLLARHAKLLVVACNSATAAALPALRERSAQTTLGVDVLGVVGPEAVQAVTTTRNGRIGLLGTPATVASGAYARAVHAADPHVDLVSVPCPDLAPIIQAGSPFDQDVLEVVRGYVAPLREAGVDTVILGCTHYPLVRPMLQRMLGPRRRDRHLGRGARASGRARARLARARLAGDRRRQLRVPLQRRSRRLPRAGNALPAAAARPRRAGAHRRGGGAL